MKSRKRTISKAWFVISFLIIPFMLFQTQSSVFADDSGTIERPEYPGHSLHYQFSGGKVDEISYPSPNGIVITGTTHPGETFSVSITGTTPADITSSQISLDLTQYFPDVVDQDIEKIPFAPGESKTMSGSVTIDPKAVKVRFIGAVDAGWCYTHGCFNRTYTVYGEFKVVKDNTAETYKQPIEPAPTPTSGCVDSETRFSDLSGKVDVAPFDDPEDFDSASLSRILCVGDRVRTGRNSSAILSFGDLTTFYMRSNTTIILSAPAQHDGKIKVVFGNIWHNIKKSLKDGSMEVLMNEAAATVKGTTFITEETGSESRLKVVEGVVLFTALADGKSVDVGPGETVAATSDGLGVVEKFDISGEISSWKEIFGNEVPMIGAGQTNGLLSGTVIALLGAGLVGILTAAVLFLQRGRKTKMVPGGSKKQGSRNTGVLATTCSICGNTVRGGAQFCRTCGAEIKSTQDKHICPSCGQPVRAGAAFCRSCGNKIG